MKSPAAERAIATLRMAEDALRTALNAAYALRDDAELKRDTADYAGYGPVDLEWRISAAMNALLAIRPPWTRSR